MKATHRLVHFLPLKKKVKKKEVEKNDACSRLKKKATNWAKTQTKTKMELSNKQEDATKPEEQHQQQEEGTANHQPKRTLFVRSLPTTATTDSLTEYFSQSYVIKHAIVVTDPQTQQSKGFGFVTFADVEDAQRALEEFNGADFDGKKIKVDYAESRHREVDETGGKTKSKSVPSATQVELKKKREEERAATQPPKLIVRNLPWSIKESEDLAVLFRSFGKVKQATVPKRGGTLAGFGFVVLRGKKNAEKALEAVNGKEVDGRTLAVDWAVEKSVWEDLQKQEAADDDKSSDVQMDDAEDKDEEEGMDKYMDGGENEEEEEEEDEEDEDEKEDEEEDEEDAEEEQEDERNASTIFIRNLPFTCTDDTLYEHFTQFGSLRYARIVVDPETDRPRGTGFVCFWKPEDAMTCVRDAPKQQNTPVNEKEKDKSKKTSAIKHSVLQNETADPSGRYTLDGRVLQVARAVSKTQAAKLEEEGVSRRLVRDTDKRRLFLLSEGTVPESSALHQKLTPSEIKMREDSYNQRQSFIKKNPSLHLSLTRLSVRNIPRTLDSKGLKQLARQAVVGFAEEVNKGLRQPLSKDELRRSADTMKEAEQLRKKKGQGVVRQAKIVFEGREGSKIDEKSGAGRSRGYGFVEYFTHRHALMGLRWLNGHAVDAPTKAGAEDEKDKKKRVIVEFAIENAEVVKRRNEQQERSRNFAKGRQQEDGDQSKPSQPRGKKGNKDRGNFKDKDNKGSNNSNNDRKRKRPDSQGSEHANPEEANKVAKRNRVIAKKRMQRKGRKG